MARNGNLFSDHSRSQKPEIKISVLLKLSGDSGGEPAPAPSPGSSWLRRPLGFFSSRPHHSHLCLCRHMASVMRLCPNLPLLIRMPVVGSKDPACSSVTLSNPRYTSKDPASKQGGIHRFRVDLNLGRGHASSQDNP